MSSAFRSVTKQIQVVICKVKVVCIRHKQVLLLGLMTCFVVYTLLLDLGYPYGNPDVKLAEDPWKSHTDEGEGIGDPFCDIYPITSPYKADFDCVRTKSVPAVSVCLFDYWSDMYISHDLKATGLWEWHVLKDIQIALSQDPSMGFIDLGANVGFYSVIAAKMGHTTVAVEPFLESVYRIHKAALLNKVEDKVTIVRNAVADVRLKGTVRTNGNNQGDTRILLKAAPCIGSCPPTVDIILMNDLLEVTNFTRAVIKMDIQGYEHRALTRADKLLDTIDVPYIFTEWLMMKDYYTSPMHISSDKYIIDEMLQGLFSRNYRPFQLSYDGGAPLDPNNWHTWPNDIIWHKMPDAKEYGKLMRNHFLRWPV